jgi:hypothetical protein
LRSFHAPQSPLAGVGLFYLFPLYTQTKNGVAIFSLENYYGAWFSIHKSVVTLVSIGITKGGLDGGAI